MNSADIRNTAFEIVRKGYRREDVDAFLLEVANQMDALVAAKEDAENKMYILAQKVEEYRGQEDTLKTALINAQRMGETVVHEAKVKADTMIREATGKAELLRQQAEQQIDGERHQLERMSNEVTRFRTTVLGIYKQHIESLSALDNPVARAEEFLDTHPSLSELHAQGEEADLAEGTNSEEVGEAATELVEEPAVIVEDPAAFAEHNPEPAFAPTQNLFEQKDDNKKADMNRLGASSVDLFAGVTLTPDMEEPPAK